MAPEVKYSIDNATHRISAFIDGQNVGGISVVPVDFDWGLGTILPMGGIAAVGTSSEHRGLGIASRCQELSVQHTRDIGCPVGGVSTGVDNFARRLYSRAGYVHLFHTMRYARTVANPEPAPEPWGVEVRPFRAGDERAIVALWSRFYSGSGYFGGRPKEPVSWLAERSELLAKDPHSMWVALRAGTVIGWAEYYFHWKQGEDCNFLVEPADDSHAVALALLTRLERSLYAAGLKRFSVDATVCETHLSTVLSACGLRPSNGYVFAVAIFDLANTLKRLGPLFAKRLAGTPAESRPETVCVKMDNQTAEVVIPGGKPGSRVEVAGPYEKIVRVLTGRSSAWEEYLRGYIALKSDLGVQPAIFESFLGRKPFFHPRRDRW